MAKIKHIALSTQDPEKTAAFYKEALGLEEVGKVNSPLAEGYYLTDGSINVAIAGSAIAPRIREVAVMPS